MSVPQTALPSDTVSSNGAFSAYSGTGTAGDAFQGINSNQFLKTGVYIANNDDAENIVVRASGSSDGITIGAGKALFLPVANLNMLQIKNGNGTDATYSYFAT